MALIPINITGQSNTSRSRPLSAQVTQNFYAEIADNESVKSPYVLMPFFGLKRFGGSPGPGLGRGLLEHNGVLYRVSGTKLYSVDTIGVHTELGTISGSNRCIMQGIGSSVVVVSHGRVYEYDGTSVTLGGDIDLESPQSGAHLNSRMLYDGIGGRFGVSDVGVPLSVDGLNYATAESNADDLVRVFAHGQNAYMMGAKTIEPWWNDGVGNPPMSRIEGAIMQVGLGALHSVGENDKSFYFLGDDSHVYQVSGLEIQSVTSTAIHGIIESFIDVSEAIGFCFTWQNQNFYCIIFPIQDRSFLYSEKTGWSEISSKGGRTFANSHAYVYRKHIVEDYRSGVLHEWDENTYDDAGEPQIRIRDTGPIHGGLFGKPGLTVEMDSFELIMETGVGLLDGQGKNPEIMLQFSDDGGKSWGTEFWQEIGSLGEFQHVVRWRSLGSFVERIVRVKISDPVFCSIHSASAELSVGI